MRGLAQAAWCSEASWGREWRLCPHRWSGQSAGSDAAAQPALSLTLCPALLALAVGGGGRRGPAPLAGTALCWGARLAQSLCLG